jgi:sugar phosphate isomerase/epimerase
VSRAAGRDRAGRLSVSTALFDGYPVEAALEEIAAAGAGAVEPAYISGYIDFDETAFSDAAAAGLERKIRAAGLSALALSAHVNLGEPEAAEKIHRRLAFAHGIGAGILVTNAAPALLRDVFRRNVETVLPRCEAAGVILAVENPGHGSDALVPSGAAGGALVAEFASPWLRLNYDFGNVFTYSGERVTPEDDFEAALPFTAQVHVKDVSSTPEGWAFTAIGHGTIRYDRIAPRVAALAPDLPVCLELPLRLRRPMRRDPERRSEPVPIDTIRTALCRSIEFWTAALSRAA